VAICNQSLEQVQRFAAVVVAEGLENPDRPAFRNTPRMTLHNPRTSAGWSGLARTITGKGFAVG
jgi:hypothetical protein